MLLPLVGLIVFTGVYPKPMLDRIEPSVDRLIAHVEEHSDYERTVAERRRSAEPTTARSGEPMTCSPKPPTFVGPDVDWFALVAAARAARRRRWCCWWSAR